MRLISPSYLVLAIFPFLALVYFLLKSRVASRRTLNLSGPTQIMIAHSKRTRLFFRLLLFAFLVVFGLLAFVVSRPMVVKSWVQKWTEGVDIAIVLDVSESMEANDLQPTRILAAKSVIREFVNHRPEDRIGLVVFGGESILKSPLTRDFDFLLSQVEDIRLRELKQGTAIGLGLANGITRLRHSESKNKIIILLTDGDSNVGAINPVTAAHLARQEGIRVYPIGIGAQDRVVVPIYAYDAAGNKTQLIAQVPSYINPELLKQIATITGGKSYMARDNGMLSRILQDIDALEKTKIKMLPMSKREEIFFIPASIATVLLTLILFLQETRLQKRRIHAL